MAIDTSKLYRIAIAAQRTGVGRTTLLAAIDRGELTVYETGDGLPLVTLADVRKWAKKERRIGRPPKSE